MTKVTLNRKLNTFDMTNLVIGSVVGADIYVITGIGAKLMGPSSLIVWVATGIMAMVIALSFAYCVMMVPKAGGPYAYAKEVATPFIGFEVGWALLLSEWLALAVFPVAFVQYFSALFPGITGPEEVLLKGAFILVTLVTNLIGVKAAGRFNDVLTIAKLTPLALIVVGGLAFIIIQPSTVAHNLTPFFSGHIASAGQAMVLIMWAYAGFELSTLPAEETESPERTIPKAIVLGMTVVIVFYLLTNLIVMGTISQEVIGTASIPLLESSRTIFAFTGSSLELIVLLMGVGALISILGVDESGTLGTSRLAYAMAVDGLLPHRLSRLHPRFGTPYLMLLVLCSTAFVASLLGGIMTLINATVFLLSFVYLSTCVSALLLYRRNQETARRFKVRPWVCVLGAGMSLFLMVNVGLEEIVVSLVLIAAGVPVCAYFSPGTVMSRERAAYLSSDSIIARAYRQSKKFAAFPVALVRRYYHDRVGVGKAFRVEHENIKK